VKHRANDKPLKKQTSKVQPNKNISGYSVLICQKVSGFVNVTEESKKGLEISTYWTCKQVNCIFFEVPSF